MAQTAKNLPTMQEAWVPFLGREDPLQKGMATRSRIPAWRVPGACMCSYARAVYWCVRVNVCVCVVCYVHLCGVYVYLCVCVFPCMCACV